MLRMSCLLWIQPQHLSLHVVLSLNKSSYVYTSCVSYCYGPPHGLPTLFPQRLRIRTCGESSSFEFGDSFPCSFQDWQRLASSYMSWSPRDLSDWDSELVSEISHQTSETSITPPHVSEQSTNSNGDGRRRLEEVEVIPPDLLRKVDAHHDRIPSLGSEDATRKIDALHLVGLILFPKDRVLNCH